MPITQILLTSNTTGGGGVPPGSEPESANLINNFNISSNIRRRDYDQGYFNDDVNWFDSRSPSATSTPSNVDIGTELDDLNIDNYSIQWTGYFRAPVTGNYVFRTTSDDASYFWIGAVAIDGYTQFNANVNNGGLHGPQTVQGTPVSLIADSYYPIRAQFGEQGGGAVMVLEYTTNGVTINPMNYMFYDTTTDDGFEGAELVLALTAADYAGSGATWAAAEGSDATLFNSPAYAAGPPALFTFDRASAQYATVSDLGSLNRWTVETWFRLNTVLNAGITDITAVVCNQFNDTNINFSIGTNRQPSTANICVGFYTNSSWYNTTGFAPSTNAWYHVVGTYDGRKIKQYINGNLLSGETNVEFLAQSGGEVRIARRWDSTTSSGNLFPGDIAEVRISRYVLTATQVLARYDATRSTYGL